MAQFTNQARLSYNDSVINSNIAVGEILEVLSVSKTAIGDSYTLGDDITYVISVINTGATSFTGLTVTDNLGAYPFGESATLYPLSYVEDSVRLFVNGKYAVKMIFFDYFTPYLVYLSPTGEATCAA